MADRILDIYTEITKKLVSKGVIKHHYQSSIIEYNYIKNTNQYKYLCKDIPDLDLDICNPVKRLQKLKEYIRSKLETQKQSSNVLLTTLLDLIEPNTDEGKYTKLVERIKQNVFYNPVTLPFLVKKCKVISDNFIYSDDIFYNPTYSDEWFFKNIIENSYVNWTMGCLLEKAFFNVRKNDLYVNIFLQHDDSKKLIITLGLFIENYTENTKKLEELTESCSDLQFNISDEKIKKYIQKHHKVARYKVKALDFILQKMMNEAIFSGRTSNDIEKFRKQIINPFFGGTKKEIDEVLPKLELFFNNDKITIENIIKIKKYI